MNGEYRTQLLVGARILELARAVIGVETHVRLHHATIQLTCLDGVYVEHRPPGRFYRAAPAMLGAILVDQTAYGATCGIVNTGDAARTDEIGRAHVRTPVTNAHLVCRLLLEKKKS